MYPYSLVDGKGTHLAFKDHQPEGIDTTIAVVKLVTSSRGGGLT